MKVTQARIHLIETGKLHPVIVELRTDEGLTGIGEAGIAYGAGGLAAAAMARDLAQRFVLGRDPGRIEEIWSEIYDHSFWAKGGGPIVFAGISALEQALWDIKGKALGAPVHALLGGAIGTGTRAYCNGWYGDAETPDDFARALARPLREGWTALKCYPLARRMGRNLRHVSRRMVDREAMELAVARVARIRREAGPGVEIMLDLSGGLTAAESIRLCRRMAEHDILFVEEPADPFDPAALRRIADAVEMPLAAGERVYTAQGFRHLCEARAVDIVQPDIGNSGGLLEAKKICAMAQAFGMRAALHNCGSTLATAAALNLAACIPNHLILEVYPYFREEPGYVEVLEEAPEDRIRDGRLAWPERPGLGVTLAAGRMAGFVWAEIGI